MNFHLGLGLFCLSFFLPGRAAAQSFIHAVHHFSVESGLPHRVVYDVQQDDQGFVWLAAHPGIFIFNGYDYQPFKLSRRHRRYRLFKDADGLIWAGSHVFEKPRIRPKVPNLDAVHQFDIIQSATGTATEFDVFFAGKCPFREADIRFVRQVADKIWVETKQGVCYAYEGGGVFRRRFEMTGELAGAFNAEPAANGNFWICRAGTCREFDPGGAVRQTYTFEQPDTIWDYKADESGGLWVTTLRYVKNSELLDSELFHCFGGKKVRRWKVTSSVSSPYFSMKTSHVSPPCNDGVRWVWSLGRCQALDEAGNAVFDLVPLMQENHEERVKIFAVFTDRQNRRWVATNNGVFVVSLRKNLFRWFFHKPGEVSSFRGMAQDSRGTIYLNTYSDTPFQLRLPEDRAVSPKFPFNAISLALWRDAPADVLWLSSHQPFIRSFDLATEKATVFPFSDGKSNEAHAIFRDSRSRQLWVGKTDDGLACLDSASGTISLAKAGFPRLLGKSVRFFHENAEGLWLATNEGLFLLDVAAKTSRQFSTATGDLLFDNLVHVCEDRRNANVFWLSTHGGGLLKWNRKLRACEAFSTTEGFSSSYVHAAYEGDSVTLWLPSNNGLMRFDKRTGKADVFTAKDGLPSNEFNFLSHLRSADGNLYFGGMNGVVAFRPEELSAAMPPPAALRLVVAEALNEGSKSWENRLPEIKEKQQIILRPDDLSLTLKLALLDYLNPGGNRFTYRIEGLDRHEIPVQGNVIRLGSLPSGNYRLLVEGRPASGFGTFSSLSLPLLVQPPFWQTWQFMALVALALAALTFAIIRFRTRQLRLQKARLEWLVASRAEELLEKNQRLEQANATKDRLFSIISHELKDHAVSFLSIAQKVNYLLKNNQPERLLQLGDHVEKSARNLEGLLNNLLGWALAQREGIACRPEPAPVGEIVAETLSIFQPLAEPKGICFKTQIPFGTSVFADKQAFATVLRNLVGNAVKFSPQNTCVQIWADLTETGKEVEIVVQNGGLSISPDRLATLFKTYPGKSTPGTVGEKGAGLGLTLCKYLVEMNGGSIRLESEAGKGTKVLLLLPSSRKEIFEVNIHLQAQDVSHVC